MITLHRLTGEEFLLNAQYIESVDFNPDTRITLANGKQIYVREDPAQIRKAVVVWQRLLQHSLKGEAAALGGS